MITKRLKVLKYIVGISQMIFSSQFFTCKFKSRVNKMRVISHDFYRIHALYILTLFLSFKYVLFFGTWMHVQRGKYKKNIPSKDNEEAHVNIFKWERGREQKAEQRVR